MITHALSLGMTEVIEQVILPPVTWANLSMASCTMPGVGVVVWVDRFAHLEVDIRILGGAAKDGMFGGKASCPMGTDQVIVDEAAELFIRKLGRSW